MPAQQGVGRDDGRNLAQPLAAQAERADGQPTSVVIGQLQTSAL